MNIDVQFCRLLLREVIAEVRAAFPGIKVGQAWVWKFQRDQWEFHGPQGFYWHGRAANAYDARTKGWQAYLSERGRAA